MLTSSMDGTYGTRIRWADKIAFFGLFIVVLLIAHFLVLWRSAVALSEPIELDCAALSVCMPTGSGWRSEKQWKYQQNTNTFTLDSFLVPRYKGITTVVSCRYLLAATRAAPDVLFEEMASTVGGAEVVKTGQIKIGGRGFSFAKGSQGDDTFVLDWAHIKKSKTLLDTFLGILQLPNDRRLNIEVHQTTGDTNVAEEIFKSVAGSLKITDNQLLEAGSGIVAEIRDKGLDSFLAPVADKQGQSRESFFLIKDAGGHAIGFTMEVLGFTEPERLGAGSSYYIRGRYQRATFFQSDNRFDEFVWKSRTSSPAGSSSAEAVLAKDGVMTVKEFDHQLERIYRVGPAAIPDVLADFIFSQMLDSDRKEIFVDIIEADGKITPILVSRIEMPPHFVSQKQSGANEVTQEEAAYVFRVKFLDGQGFFEQVYLDDQRQISKKLLQQESIYTFERTGAENIIREFPEQSSLLRKKDKILDNQLQGNGEW